MPNHKNRERWSDEEKLLLKDNYPNCKPHELVALFSEKFTEKQIGVKAKKMGICKSEEYRAANGIDATGRRIKGGTPWNKGIHYHAGGMSVNTQFKKGHKQNQECPIGSTRINKYGYLEIKVRNRTKTQSGYVSLHREVWKQHYGKYPPRNCPVIFLNGDKQDCRIENLKLISRTELMKMNTIHNLPDDLKQLIGMRIILKRKIEGTYYGRKRHQRTSNNSV